MARPRQITGSDLVLQFQAGGVLTAQALAERFRVNQSTISRGLSRLGDSVVAFGAARRARYALRRVIRDIGNDWPVQVVTAEGRAREWARLEALHGGYRVTWAGAAPAWAEQALDREGFTTGVPFFLTDLRPQGFLGRREAQRVAEGLRLPADPRQWSDDDTILFLQAEGGDMPGNLILGERPLRRMLARQLEEAAGSEVIPEERRSELYPDLAIRAAAGGLPGSSAGGEQPKFLTAVRRAGGAIEQVLVKFSPTLDSPAGRRWGDLLIAEAQAHAVLAERGLASAAHVIEGGGRRFLEVVRYDRVGAHGRRGTVSLEALHGAFDAAGATDWPSVVEAFVRTGLVGLEGLAAVRRLHAFGELIGNVDMHFGNLSFWFDDALPFRPAPAYDMLPMAWAPNVQGELMERPYAPRPPLPAAMVEWSEAAGWAAEFWRRVGADERISREFAAIARAAGERVARMRAHFGA